MGIKVTLDVFQSPILGLFINIEGVIVYIDDIIIIGAGIFEDHMTALDKVLRRLEEKMIQVNPLKSFWGQAEVEYLRFLVTREGIQRQQINYVDLWGW